MCQFGDMSDPRRTRPRPRFGSVISIRLSAVLLNHLRRTVAGREERVSEFIRAAVRERLAAVGSRRESQR